MSVQELSALHTRYIELSARFKAAWTYHQFLEGLRKIFSAEGLEELPSDLESPYSALREASQNLGASTCDQARRLLDQAERRLQKLTDWLQAQDSKVAPSLLRRFFRRLKRYDEKVLLQMLRFYLYARPEEGWSPERIDKVDFLVTRLTLQISDPELKSDRGRLQETFRGLWRIVGDPSEASDSGASYRRPIDEFRRELERMENLEALDASGLVARYREHKHQLGRLYFQPELLLAIAETNLAFRRRTRELRQQEEGRIFSDRVPLADLEREAPLDAQAQGQLTGLRAEIQKLQGSIEEGDVRLDDLARVGRQIRTLLPRLSGPGQRGPQGDLGSDPEGAPGARLDEDLGRYADAFEAGEVEELLREDYCQLLELLERQVDRLSLARPTVDVGLPSALHRREIAAYRRLAAEGSDAGVLETTVLKAAALRQRIHRAAAMLRGSLDETEMGVRSGVLERAERTTRLADLYLRTLGHMSEKALAEGKAEEAREIQYLRMLLMRSYSGLWLLVQGQEARS